MKNIIFLMLVVQTIFAQEAVKVQYGIDDFILIENVKDQEKQYNKMLKEFSSDLTNTTSNDLRAELAVQWLAKGNVKRYQYYKDSNPRFSARQFIYLVNALEKLFDEKKKYNDVKNISAVLLKELEDQKLEDGVSRTPVLMELNAASNAKLGNIQPALELIEKSSKDQGSSSREIKYFKDMKANYLNRYAIVMSAAGKNQVAYDTLCKALKDAESNPYMIPTFKEVYKKVKGTNKGVDQLIKTFQDQAYQKYYNEVADHYISSPQTKLEGTIVNPDDSNENLTLFTADKQIYDIALQNLDGIPVNFSSYKGKVLAIDFWTTLCTPCVSAFYGFEKVIADYKKNDFKMFVINIFETEATVKAYVKQKGITLDVLRDEENIAYNIQGTPTKIIFDTEGNIRFYAAGYAGSTDREYYKLKAMIEITKKRSTKL